jgi:hypothetical protein
VVRFFGGGHVGSLEARKFASDGDDVSDGGDGVALFSAADSPRAFGRIMPRAAWRWTDRAMQRSFHCLGRRRLWDGKRQPPRAPPRFYRFGGHGSPHGRSKATRGRCRRSEAKAGDSKGEGGGRRGAALSGWLPPLHCLPSLQTGCTPRSLGDPFSLLLLPPTHDPLPALRFLPVNRGGQMTLAMTSSDGIQIGLSP